MFVSQRLSWLVHGETVPVRPWWFEFAGCLRNALTGLKPRVNSKRKRLGNEVRAVL